MRTGPGSYIVRNLHWSLSDAVYKNKSESQLVSEFQCVSLSKHSSVYLLFYLSEKYLLQLITCFSVVKLCPTLCDPWTAACQASLSFSISWNFVYHWVGDAISSSVVPFSSCLQSCPASGSFPVSQLFASGGQSIVVSASASVLPVNILDWFPLGLVWSPCSPRDSQESSPTPQFKSISFSAFSLLYGPVFTSIHDYWGKPYLDYMDLCQQSTVSTF